MNLVAGKVKYGDETIFTVSGRYDRELFLKDATTKVKKKLRTVSYSRTPRRYGKLLLTFQQVVSNDTLFQWKSKHQMNQKSFSVIDFTF